MKPIAESEVESVARAAQEAGHRWLPDAPAYADPSMHADPPTNADPPTRVDSHGNIYLAGILLILSIGAIYVAKAILLPVFFAFLLTLTLSPLVRLFARHHVPEAISAFGIIVSVVGIVGFGAWSLGGPLSGWVDSASGLRGEIEQKFERLRQPLAAVIGASKQVERIARTEDPSVQKVVVQEQGLIGLVADNAFSVLTTGGITVVLAFFLLSSGRMFYEKLVRVLPTLAEKKRAIRIVHSVEEEVSRYLLTITAINCALGIAIGLAMWGLGMPNPALWGVMAALFNYMPYVGALAGVAIVSIVALVSFDALGAPFIIAASYFGLTLLEGQFITPAIVGRRLEMNTVAVFLSVAFWGWLWGVPGALMAVPLLVALRVLCEHFDGLAKLGEFLAGPVVVADEDEAAR